MSDVTERWPFGDAEGLAKWVAKTLGSRGVDALVDWTMVEYWMQLELYRAIKTEGAGPWRYFGDDHCHYEQPYATKHPHLGKSRSCKFADLIVTRGAGEAREIVWIELKDLGRSKNTYLTNARGVGQDLAALWGLKVEETAKEWKNPRGAVKNKIQEHFWREKASEIRDATHFGAQVILCPKKLVDPDGVEEPTKPDEKEIERRWRGAFNRKIEKPDSWRGIGRSETNEFVVLATVLDRKRRPVQA